jgi:hypothetical protein
MAERYTEDWDLWYPKAGSTGLPFARGRIGQAAEVLLVHAPPEVLTVTVRAAGGGVLAEGADLRATAETPIARLMRRGARVEREDIWPGQDDIGRLVLLPGGEVGALVAWWHADDRSEWRWRLELSNRREV